MARDIENYYENLVYDEITRQIDGARLKKETDYIDDIACVALNQLPARYVRHHVDLIYYLTGTEQQEILDSVRTAVSNAIDLVNNHRR